MPPTLQVTTLQGLCLQSISKIMCNLCLDSHIYIYELTSIVEYFKRLPRFLQSSIYKKFVLDYRKNVSRATVNEKHVIVGLSLQSNELYINDFNKSLHYISIFEGTRLKKLLFCSDTFEYPLYEVIRTAERFSLYRPLYHFMKTLSNLTTFHSTKMCDNHMFEIFASHCPLLEEIFVELCYHLSDEGICYLCGYKSIDEAKSVLRTGDIIQRKTVCTKLKSITLDYTLASDLSVAILLHSFPKLEYLCITPDINLGNVFTMLFGHDSTTYNAVNKKYALTTLKSSLEIEESILSLVVQTCPYLQYVTFRCYGNQRSDKNILANLLTVPVTNLTLMNCNTEVLIWYLKERGENLKHLDIEHLISAPPTVYLDRSHLQYIIQFCPNLESFSLRMCGNVSISPNVPYSSFGQDLLYFTSLSTLVIEGVSLEPDDFRVLVQKNTNLHELRVMCESMEILEDLFLYDLLSKGTFKNLKTLYIFKPSLSMSGLYRLLMECPKLQMVGPLSSWFIARKDIESLVNEIKFKNWDLNIESPEQLGIFY